MYRQIVEQLRDLIRRQAFKAGSRLPPERDLALQLNVSRPSVREALIALEVEGWIEIRMGSGIYVCERNSMTATSDGLLADAPGPLELIRARALIEGEVAALAARMVKKTQLIELEETVQQMQVEAAAGQMPLHGDRLFHLGLAKITGNTTLVLLVAELFDQRSNPLSRKLGQHFETEKSWKDAIAEHRQVIAALSQKDPEAARAAMQHHMGRSHRRYTVRLG